ncbi:MAG: tetratricopeptide repeat protein [Candidatus Cloacimonetes bacterium]|nr:tetratricopeptide repeat protein [Candidatus Cloacimonadota bacterium]
MKKLFIPLLLLLLAIPLLAQYNERDILSQQAYQHLGQRQFAEAEKLFLEVLEKFPDDTNSVLQLFNIYFQTAQTDKADDLLRQHRRILPVNQASEQEILLRVMQGRPDEAWQLGQAYLQRSGYAENTYRLLASYFERRGFYDRVLQLYEEARSKRGNPDLFRLEMANAALNYRRFDLALHEYLTFLEKNPGNLFFVNNQCKTILTEDPGSIEAIRIFAQNSPNPIIRELYANALVSQKQDAEALEVFKTLPQDRLLNFADQQYKAFNDEVALASFAWLQQITDDVVDRNDYRLRQAYIHFRNGRHVETDSLLQEVVADSLMLDRKNYQRKGINLSARRLLADNLLALQLETTEAAHWYGEARRFCTTAYDLQNIDLALVRLMMIDEDYDSALSKLAGISESKHLETRDYLLFSVELLRGNIDEADSLMNDYVIHYPGGIYVNDAIYQMMFSLGLQGEALQNFHKAIRQMMLSDPAAVETLVEVFEDSQDEEILSLAIEWAILLAKNDRALQLLEREWEDSLSAEYASYLKLTLSEGDGAQRLARDFLKENPNSIFSPKFRQDLGRSSYGRPEY